MVMCFAPTCKHYSEKQTCSFFRFPKDPALAKKWANAIKRGDREPSVNSLICSCHFVNKDRKNLPTLFSHNEEKRFRYASPEKRKASKKKREDEKQVRESECLSSSTSHVSEEAGPSTSSSDRYQLSLQNLSLNTSNEALKEAEMYFLKKQNEELNEKLQNLSERFSFDKIKDDKLLNTYTGIPNRYLFDSLFSLFENIPLKYFAGWTVGNINKKDQFLITLMKFRLNLLHADLACRFNCSSSTISNIINTWTYALYEVLVCQLMKDIPSRQKNKTCLPSCFSTFTNCRIVLDCTEVKCHKPSSMVTQRLTYSSYKHMNTFKVLIGVAPNGVITFTSKLYPGSMSDKKIVQNCGILDKIEEGDLILADKGFLIKDLLPQGVSLNVPPFLTTPQFTPQQAVQTRTIARARIHVERAIQRLKMYAIINNMPKSMVPHASMIFKICAALTNMQFPIIAEVEELYD